MLSPAADDREQGRAMGNNESIQVGAESVSGLAGGALAALLVEVPLLVVPGVGRPLRDGSSSQRLRSVHADGRGFGQPQRAQAPVHRAGRTFVDDLGPGQEVPGCPARLAQQPIGG